MKRALALWLVLISLIWAAAALASGGPRPWELEVPEGWVEIDPGFELTAISSDKAESWACFRNGSVDVEIIVSPVAKSAEEAVWALHGNLESLGRDYPKLKASTMEPERRGETWVQESLMGPVRSFWYITSHDGRYSLITISVPRGESLEPGRALLRQLRPTDPKLFPSAYD